MSQSYIHPAIREKDAELPEEWLQEPPWALEDREERGSYRTFRAMVWRSLLHYYGRHLRYDYFDAFRLTEIQFGREDADIEGNYRSVRELKDLDLLVLVSGLAEPANPYVLPLTKYVQTLRRMHGRPTWLYRPGADSKPAPDLPHNVTPPAARSRMVF